MILDISPIIPDLPDKIREPYNLALTKFLRANDHKIISSYVKYYGSSVTIELSLKCDTEMNEILQSLKDLKIKELDLPINNPGSIPLITPPPPPSLYYRRSNGDGLGLPTWP